MCCDVGTHEAIIHDMSRQGKRRSDSAFRTLRPDQQRAWLAYMRVQLRLTYEMNRQLQADSNLSLSDYDVLNALRYAPGGRMRVTALAALISWGAEQALAPRPASPEPRARGVPSSADGSSSDRGNAYRSGLGRDHPRVQWAHRPRAKVVLRGLAGRAARAAHRWLESVYDNIIDRGTLPASR